ncbi:MAG: LamG-like jellyroll fold domain-containing protein [Bacteroidota bacterium]
MIITFDFNDREIKEKNNKIIPKAVGASLVEDRFGNQQSALYLHGNPGSYFVLGNSSYLKPKTGSISIWVNLDRIVYAGKGSEANPVIGAKNGPQDDFNCAYAIFLDYTTRRFGVASHKDSTQEVNIKSENEIMFNTWYHLVFTFDASQFAFYVNGKLQQSTPKKHELNYLEGDSVMIGNSGSKKNFRWSQGIFDDIQIFHRALSQKEIQKLYEAPNPNKTKQFFIDAAKYMAIILVFIIIVVIIIIRNRQKLKKQKEQFELHNRINELEIKVIKNQMNPHFISNCMAAIQELIYTENYKKAAQYIAKFSFFLRQVLNYSDKTYITLEEELTLIKLNIELEQLRFKEEFDCKINIDHSIELDKISIPSLITQPFIENAIWHGLLPLKNKRKACLTITISEKNDCVFIEIADNGVGRNGHTNQYSSESKGTKMVMDKIESINRLLQGNDYKLDIVDLYDETNDPAGTKIIIQLKNSKE